jgi:Ca-activated chloride channel family protein
LQLWLVDHFVYWQLLFLLLFVPLSYWWLQHRAKKRRRNLQKYLGARLEYALHQQHGARYRNSRVLFCSALFFSLLAIAQPRWGDQHADAIPTTSRWLFCLDVSKSMLAQDQVVTSPTSSAAYASRLQAARQFLNQFCQSAQGDSVALIHFAGQARLAVPWTEDMLAFREILELSGPESVGEGGSDLGAALKLALPTLQATSGAEPTGLVVLTDGEDWGESLDEDMQKLSELKIPINCLGFGSRLGSKIPVDGGFLQDSQNADVVTAMNQSELQRIARQSGGLYADAATEADVVQFVLEQAPRRQPESASEDGDVIPPGSLPNRFQWPLAIACLLWLLELLAARGRSK